ncbi:CDK-activating kinase assembly factor [Pseudoneurospora amorphoporcata]|uniref:RNA polymerase II transcription factor B subunit 3 n=1 Tax=Pseudoneurospora amorphoporcata TaxID=241081 RepID=A0AAN6P401_9PEZI|nr:CDK-activating kinase assembly factor [Pseudoneurospora amorphoporcata]
MARPLDPLGFEDEMCPVCKSRKYLNPDIVFVFNPECYHSMCLNCANRLFNDGPNQCPHAGCNKTLRRKGFRSAFFGDLSVEREVDIRRRVAAVFNQKEDDFETLQDYNNYLQMVEDLAFELVNGSDEKRRQAEAQLAAWEAEHRQDIERNKKAGREADEMSRKRLAAERDAARQRRIEAIKEAEEEKRERVRSREMELDNLAKGITTAAEPATKVQLKRRGQRGGITEPAAPNPAAAAVAGMGASEVERLSIRGLKEKPKAPAPQGPYDPFGGMDFAPSRYKLHVGLAHPLMEKYRLDRQHVAGGYSFDDFAARALYEAFAGLGVFVEDEKEVGNGNGLSQAGEMVAAADDPDRMDLD